MMNAEALSPDRLQYMQEALRRAGEATWLFTPRLGGKAAHDFVFFGHGAVDDVVQRTLESLGDFGPALAELGIQELNAQAEHHQRLYDRIVRSSGVASETARVGQILDRYTGAPQPQLLAFSLLEGLRFRYHKYNRDDVTQSAHMVLEDLRTTSETPYADSLRDAMLMKALTTASRRSEAPSEDERVHLHAEGIEYARGFMFRDPVFTGLRHELLAYYGLESRPNVFAFLTNKGIWSQLLALESAADYVREKQGHLLFVGTPYFEVNKFPGRYQKDHGRPLFFSIERLRKDPMGVRERLSDLHDRGIPVVLYMEPIGSYKSMEVVDVEQIIQAAGNIFTGDTPCLIVMDITTAGGVFQVFEKTKPYVDQTNITLIITQSMLKYFQWGLDLTKLGSVIVQGPGMSYDSPFEKMMRRVWYRHFMEPDIENLAKIPPIEKPYMEFRANRIQRNAQLMLGVLSDILQRCSAGATLSYPALDEQNAGRLSFIGFKGSYFYIDLPPGKAEQFLQEARKHSVGALGTVRIGTSFGQNHCRISREGSAICVVPGALDICTTYFTAQRLGAILQATFQSDIL